MERKLKIALIVPDNRDEYRSYEDPQPHFGTAPSALLEGFTALSECDIHVVCCVQRPLTLPEKIGPNIFYHAEVVPKWGWMRSGYLGCIRSIRRQLKQIQPDIVHGQGTERYCALASVFSGVPNVLTLHGNMRSVARISRAGVLSYHWLAARLESFVLPRTNGVVCITSYTQKAVADLARQTWIVPNAVDASFFNVQASPDPSASPVGLCVGTICDYKNQNEFIRALDPLAERAKFKMLFASTPPEGSYGEAFRQLVHERSWCEHIGFVNREQLKARLRAASFLALPTREDNCPMVVLEAMAAGVPVLASAIGGVPDLIQHEVNGLLCDPQRPETFREAVSRFLEDPLFARRLAAEAKTQAQARFYPKIIAQRHVEIYREVIARKKLKTEMPKAET